ncbi:serine/threonine-protein kinase [Candidatus Uabimicrobium amorphum]|uniref:non-specific serine/threonine protein kinase n=1 Tax=Uabimicrobium amorphum TaxID=2596890 RepID=A0A5S9IJG8_UABAM|nr:serine/threonine-protein kinase [Candidatus Uabimicrobium amorphum]BBM82844.1 protein kinase [Candidatus Uabimicrobium amorphum]
MNENSKQKDLKLGDSFLIDVSRQKSSCLFEEGRQKYQAMQTGQSFGRYTIQEELGRGGMGIVYKAFDTHLKRVVALKVILKGEERDVQRFQRESLAMAKLDHQNIIKLYDFGIDPQPFFTMEYIEGFTLADLIKEKKVKPLFLLDLLIKVCNALAHAHENKILHRDIKPSNIMITKNGEPKIMDFGLAKTFEDSEKTLSKTGDILGSVHYMSPEQLNGKTTERSDIYSLGATMYEALTYRNVYHGDSTPDILFQLLQNDPIPPRRLNPTLSPYFEAICLKCIAKKEHKRYCDFKQLVRELKNFKAHKPIIAKKYTSWNTMVNFIRRHKIMFSAICFAFVVLVISLCVTLYALNTSQRSEEQAKVTLNETMKALHYVMVHYDYLQKDKKLGRLFTQIFDDLEKYGKSQDWSFLIAHVMSINGNERKSIEYLNKRIVNYPQDSSAYSTRGNLYQRLGDHKKALSDYNKAILLSSDNYFAYNSRGSCYLASKEYEKALVDFNKAIELNDKFANAYTLRGALYYELTQLRKALADFDKSIYLAPGNSSTYSKRGIVYASLQEYEKALKDFDKSTSLNSKDFDSYIRRAGFYTQIGKYKKAIDDYNKADLINPKKPVTYLNRGTAYHEWQKYKKALDDFNRLVSLRPIAISYRKRANTYNYLGLHEKALADYNKAISLEDMDVEVYIGRSVAYFWLKKYRKALADLDKALPLQNKNPKLYFYRAMTNYRLKKYPDALADFEKSAQLNPNNIEIYFNRGNLYFNLRQYDKSIADFDKLISIDQENINAYLARGNTYLQIPNLEKAKSDFRTVISLDPGNKPAYLNLGNTYYHLKNYQQAILAFEKIQGEWFAHRGLHYCYKALKKHRKAQYHFQRYQELKPKNK